MIDSLIIVTGKFSLNFLPCIWIGRLGKYISRKKHGFLPTARQNELRLKSTETDAKCTSINGGKRARWFPLKSNYYTNCTVRR